MFLTYLTLNTHVRCTYLPVNSSYSDIQIITKLNVIHVLRSQTLLRLQDHTTQPTCILSTQVQFIHVKSIVTVHILQTHNTYINHRYTKLNLFQTHTFVFSNLSLKVQNLLFQTRRINMMIVSSVFLAVKALRRSCYPLVSSFLNADI